MGRFSKFVAPFLTQFDPEMTMLTGIRNEMTCIDHEIPLEWPRFEKAKLTPMTLSTRESLAETDIGDPSVSKIMLPVPDIFEISVPDSRFIPREVPKSTMTAGGDVDVLRSPDHGP